jgi:hypothetical protein
MTEVLLLQATRAEADSTGTGEAVLILSGSDLCGTTFALPSNE